MNIEYTFKCNIIIANFMDVPYDRDMDQFKVTIKQYGTMSYRPVNLQYHASWDWLMPVIDKIESLGYVVTMVPHQCQIFELTGNFPVGCIIDADFKTTRLENAFDGVVGFIELYNEQTKL